MILVSEIWNEAKEIFGHCDEPKLFKQITDSIELLSSAGEIDPLVGVVDICTDGNCVTLPREVETVLGASVCGKPARAVDQLFQFHINGPGLRCGGGFGNCRFTQTDEGNWPTYKDLKCPAKLIAFLDNPEDAGKMLKVFGFDDQNRPLRTKIGETWEDGLRVPMIYGYALPAANDPFVSRITAIVKDLTVANVRLSSFDSSTSTGTLLGVYEPDETKPIYRRIKIYPCGPWMRIFYRKRSYEILTVNDRILLHSRPALLLAMRAAKWYADGDLGNGNAYEANAVRLLTQKDWTLGNPAGNPIQVVDLNSMASHCDYLE